MEITPAEIRTRAADAGVSVNQLMKAAGTSGNALWRWEQGRCSPRASTIARVMDALAVLSGQK